jgi:uncharacterized SAM-binding protein YcdF (DUF218 family)
MYVYLSKILPLFVMPVALVLILLVVALFFVRRGMKRTASGLLLLAVGLLWLASTPFVAGRLYHELESRYPPVPLADVPAGDCIVLLGGSVQAALAPRVALELNESVDRVYQAARLYRAGKSPYMVVTAGNQPWSTSPWDEADLLRDLLMEWGVPKDAIFLEGSSRNTRENAVYSKHIIDSINCQTALLVTSAAHMPRAVAAFRGVGISVVPVSTDVRVTAGGGLSAAALLPDAGALDMTSDAIREWIGQKVYAWQGWGES